MRIAFLVLAIGAAFAVIATSTGCAAIHGLDEYTTASKPSPDASTTLGAALPADGGGPPACTSNKECVESAFRALGSSTAPPAPVVCVKATGKCESLTTADCPRVLGDPNNDGAIILGTLLSAGAPSSLEQASFLAAEEINGKGGGLPPASPGAAKRPIVLVGCNAGVDARNASRHLAEALRVPAVLGPMSEEQVVEMTQQVTVKAGTLLMAPMSVASTVTNLVDGDLTWRATPSDTQRAKLIIEQIKDLEDLLRRVNLLTTVKLAIVHSSDTRGQSAREAVAAKLILNGQFLNDASNAANVSLDAHQIGNIAAQTAIATKYATTFKPDIVFVTSAEEIANVVVPLEQALSAAQVRARPYYVFTDASRTQELLDAITSNALPPGIQRRIRGVGVRPDTTSASVLEDFRTAFAARYNTRPSEPSAAVAYDATYAVAYALAATATTPPSGASVALGLRTLAVGNPASVGATGLAAVMRDLSSARSVSLRGTFGLMQWDSAGDITGGTVEVWCLGIRNGVPAFGSSGLAMDVQTQVVGGAFVQCQ